MLNVLGIIVLFVGIPLNAADLQRQLDRQLTAFLDYYLGGAKENQPFDRDNFQQMDDYYKPKCEDELFFLNLNTDCCKKCKKLTQKLTSANMLNHHLLVALSRRGDSMRTEKREDDNDGWDDEGSEKIEQGTSTRSDTSIVSDRQSRLSQSGKVRASDSVSDLFKMRSDSITTGRQRPEGLSIVESVRAFLEGCSHQDQIKAWYNNLNNKNTVSDYCKALFSILLSDEVLREQKLEMVVDWHFRQISAGSLQKESVHALNHFFRSWITKQRQAIFKKPHPELAQLYWKLEEIGNPLWKFLNDDQNNFEIEKDKYKGFIEALYGAQKNSLPRIHCGELFSCLLDAVKFFNVSLTIAPPNDAENSLNESSSSAALPEVERVQEPAVVPPTTSSPASLLPPHNFLPPPPPPPVLSGPPSVPHSFVLPPPPVGGTGSPSAEVHSVPDKPHGEKGKARDPRAKPREQQAENEDTRSHSGSSTSFNAKHGQGHLKRTPVARAPGEWEKSSTGAPETEAQRMRGRLKKTPHSGLFNGPSASSIDGDSQAGRTLHEGFRQQQPPPPPRRSSLSGNPSEMPTQTGPSPQGEPRSSDAKKQEVLVPGHRIGDVLRPAGEQGPDSSPISPPISMQEPTSPPIVRNSLAGGPNVAQVLLSQPQSKPVVGGRVQEGLRDANSGSAVPAQVPQRAGQPLGDDGTMLPSGVPLPADNQLFPAVHQGKPDQQREDIAARHKGKAPLLDPQKAKAQKGGLRMSGVLTVVAAVGLGAWVFKEYYWDPKYRQYRDSAVAA